MECLGCGYDLRGLGETRCPECGRAFDPRVRATYGPGDSARRDRRLVRWGVVAAIWPLVAVGLVHLARVGARLTLGRWPRPSIDDPKTIGPAVDALHFGAALALMLCDAALLAGTVLVLIALVNRRWRAGLIMIGLAAAGWTAALGLGRLDPGGAIEWFLD